MSSKDQEITGTNNTQAAIHGAVILRDVKDAEQKKRILEKMRERDEPLLATPSAHGPG